MQPLLSTLQDHDLGHLRIIAELWGLDLPPGKAIETARRLSQAMLTAGSAAEIAESLPAPAQHVLAFLLQHGGRLPIADLVRRFGPLREMGPGRRDREKPWREPASPLEVLWYRGLIARAFADTTNGPQEFAFIPDDLIPLLPMPAQVPPSPPGIPAEQPEVEQPASAAAVDDATTLVAALRRRPAPSMQLGSDRQTRLHPFLLQPDAAPLLIALLREEGLLSGDPLSVDPEAARPFLDSPRAEVLRRLQLAWGRARAWNDLAQVPSLTAAGEVWPNDPLVGRRAILGFLSQVPQSTWWLLDSFVEAIGEGEPAFQRPAGDFDSWYLRDARDGAFLQGYEHWDHVEGALIRYVICGPAYWLGVTDLGKASPEAPVTAFRLSPFAGYLFDPRTVPPAPEPTGGAARIQSDGRITVPRNAPGSLRYQIARFCAWDSLDAEGYHYRLSGASLTVAAQQGLRRDHVLALLEEASGGGLPPTLVSAIERWAARGAEARLERQTLLRVRSPEVLESLRRHRATARYLGETLSAEVVLVRERDREALRNAAARLGILIDSPDGGESEAP